MRSFKLLENRARYVVAAVGLFALGVVAPVVSAAQVTERSITLSSSVKAATGVSYQVTFTPAGDAQSFVVQFCDNTPLIGETCGAPDGLTVANATTSTSGATITDKATANKIVIEKTITAPTPVTVDIANMVNPSDAGALYARIITYDADGATALAQYTTTALGAAAEDNGGVALYINEGVNVSGAVLESMTFCVSGQTLDTDQTCVGTGADAPALTAPTLRLGQDIGGVIALNASAISEGTIYTQLSTNAAGGAVVRLKSNAANCGGLIRSSNPSACDIKPTLLTGITAGEAEFGLKLGADVSDAEDGELRAYPSSGYNNTTYALNYVSGNGTGVTSTYGDPILDTHDAPANNRNMPLTFGASVSNNTPAGNYSTDLSLVATGKF